MNHAVWSFACFYLLEALFLDSAFASEVKSPSLGVDIISLNGKWQLLNSNSSVSLSAEVPGCVHTALQRQGFISVHSDRHIVSFKVHIKIPNTVKLMFIKTLFCVNRIHIIGLMTWPTDGFHLTTGLTLHHSQHLLMLGKSENLQVQLNLSSDLYHTSRARMSRIL